MVPATDLEDGTEDRYFDQLSTRCFDQLSTRYFDQLSTRYFGQLSTSDGCSVIFHVGSMLYLFLSTTGKEVYIQKKTAFENMDIRNLASSFFKRSEEHETAKPLFSSVFGHRSSSPK